MASHDSHTTGSAFLTAAEKEPTILDADAVPEGDAQRGTSRSQGRPTTSGVPREFSYIKPTEDPFKKAIDYFERNHIVPLFQALTVQVARERPSSPVRFLREKMAELQRLQEDPKYNDNAKLIDYMMKK